MPRRRKRPDPSTFCLPVDQIRNGFFSDGASLGIREVLEREGSSPRVVMQIAGTATGYLGGVDEALAILKVGVDEWGALTVHALYEGDHYDRWDAVLTIDGPIAAFAHVEALCLGVLARRTRVCTNARHAIEAAASKPVIVLGERDDHFALQAGDGYAAQAGGISLVSSEAQASLISGRQLASLSYGLIAIWGGNTVGAAQAFVASISEKSDIIAPVDYENDCVRTSV
ncbi:MAG TPA: hypothetical protein VMH39_05480, partial [Gemmatimonadaceae bacterium]|nr:hypothetical protein [Gemmatimonadaceae bacterium]